MYLPFHVLPVNREERRRGHSPLLLVLCHRGEPSGEIMRHRWYAAVRERPVHPVHVPDGCLRGGDFLWFGFDFGVGGGGAERGFRAM